MMTESAEEAVVSVPSAPSEAQPTVATVATSPPRRHSDPIQPPPAPTSPYAFPPTYEEAMASKALEEGNLTPEAIATLRRDFPGRTRRIAPELEAGEVPREQLSNRVFVRQRVFIFRVCLYTFILLLVVAAIVISVIKSTGDMTSHDPALSSPSPQPSTVILQSLPMLIGVLLCVAFFPTHVVASSYRPCDGKSKIGGPCDINADCENKGSVCLRGRCRCHAHYVEVVDDKGMNPSCQRLPSKIGAECSVKCREPLFCRNGRCQCVQRGSTSLRNGECVTVSRVGDRCSRHYDCTAPFSACLNSQCVCISGTVQQGSRCVATANCPLGGVPSGSCVRRASMAQVHNFVPDSDDCPAGYVCITSEESPTGHCCPKVCPLGSHIDINYSCEPNANSSKCPSDTHFCYRISDGGFSQSSCCRRPCNALAPNALYLHGECVARGQLNSECTSDSQCGGGEGMECVAGKCACMKSFHPFIDALTHPTNNPSQLCAKDCEKVRF